MHVHCTVCNARGSWVISPSWQEKPQTTAHRYFPYSCISVYARQRGAVHQSAFCVVDNPRVHSGTSGTANRQTHPPPGQNAGECRGLSLTGSPWILCRNKSDKWFPAVKLLLATSDDAGEREVERWPRGTFAASDTCECARPSSGRPQLWLWDRKLVQLEKYRIRGLDSSTRNGWRSTGDGARSGPHHQHIIWSIILTLFFIMFTSFS